MANFKTGRRGMLGVATAALAAPLLPRTPAIRPAHAADLDSELIQLCADLAACRAEVEHNNRVGVPDDVCDRTMDRWTDLVDRIIDIPARTPEGVRAKAGATRDVLKVYLMDGPGRSMSLAGEQEDWIGWSLVHDILGEAPPWT